MRPNGNAERSPCPLLDAVRLLFDEPLSEALVDLLADVFPRSLHVRQIGAGGAADDVIWNIACERDCLLVNEG